ncbi:MAG TPA: hypothetical protein VF265_09345 [Nevskiaceae bacterium]
MAVTPRNRGRLQGLFIVLLFMLPVAVALVMGFLGWAPKARSYGQPIQPEVNVAKIPVRLADGRPFSWTNRDAVWTLVALPGPGCARRCTNTLELTHRAQIALGASADKLRLLYLAGPASGSDPRPKLASTWAVGIASSEAFAADRPSEPDSVSAVLVTPDGKAFIRYAANFNADGLRGDLAKVVH